LVRTRIWQINTRICYPVENIYPVIPYNIYNIILDFEIFKALVFLFKVSQFEIYGARSVTNWTCWKYKYHLPGKCLHRQCFELM